MTYIITDASAKAVREALKQANSYFHAHGSYIGDDAIAILDKLQRVEVVANCTWGGKIEHLHAEPPSLLVGRKLYAIKGEPT
jgi:hypothetical protein